MRKPFGKSLFYSFLAMALGWIACNITFLLWSQSRLFPDPMRPLRDKIYSFACFCGFTGIVIACTWGLIFFPAFYFVRTRSWVWNPVPASLLGAVFGYVTVYGIFLGFVFFLQGRINIQFYLAEIVHHNGDTWPFYIGGMVTGFVAALFSALLKKEVREIDH